MPLRAQRGNRQLCRSALYKACDCFVRIYDVFAKKLFVILNAVKDLLFAMFLRPAQSANRSFVPQDDKLFKRHFPFSVPPDSETSHDKL
jgi:hypothetical protein